MENRPSRGEAVEDERQGPSGEEVGFVGETIMQVGAQRRAGVPDLGKRCSGLHYIADLNRNAPRVQVLIEREDIRGDFEDHMIAAVVFLRFRDHCLVRGCLRLAVLDRNDGSIGDREHVLLEGVVLLVLAAVAIEDSAVLDLGPVDSEGFGSLDAKAVYGDTKIAVKVGLAASAGNEPAISLYRWPEHHGRLAGDG